MNSPAYNELTPEEARVLLHKGTERPYVGEYTKLDDAGTFICRRCNTPLYRSADKFDSHCGWPSFDEEIAGTVRRERDADGHRIEILCAELRRPPRPRFPRRAFHTEKHAPLREQHQHAIRARRQTAAAGDQGRDVIANRSTTAARSIFLVDS